MQKEEKDRKRQDEFFLTISQLTMMHFQATLSRPIRSPHLFLLSFVVPSYFLLQIMFLAAPVKDLS